MATFIPDTSNEKFQLAIQLVNQSNRNIFLTGKAGTGKTTFLKWIREHCPKQMAIIAPTGVAAINAGGVTIHSFFQLPLSPFIPTAAPTGFNIGNPNATNRHSLLKGLRYNSEKIKLIRQLELLVIDEISMVRCDMLDAVDMVLRHTRHRHFEKFGGVQLLFIGDMLQLPPVIKSDEWSLLSQYYEGPFFFNSQVLKEDLPLYIEFDKIYRQNEASFIQLLNQVRDNALDEEGIRMLENTYQPEFQPHENDGYIILTTHNNRATDINNFKLRELDSAEYAYEAEIKDEFPDRAYPAEQILKLKTGAQVMFIRNDLSDRGKRYFNGKIGYVSRLGDDKIFVKCKDGQGQGEEEIEVKKDSWENIRYSLNKSSGNLDTHTLGSFTQFPLRLAWAITIHKSQGLTFEKAIIDAGSAFAPGQVYVALSRCTNLGGLVLKSRIKTNGVLSDPAIIDFSRKSCFGVSLEQEVFSSKWKYLEAILISYFDFEIPLKTVLDAGRYIKENQSSFNATASGSIDRYYDNLSKRQQTASKFQDELKKLFDQQGTNQVMPAFQQRIDAGAGYFIKEIEDLLEGLQRLEISTDSWVMAKQVDELLRDLLEELARKKFVLEGFIGSTDIENYHKRKTAFKIPSFRFTAFAGANAVGITVLHPELYKKLKSLRDQICASKQQPIFMVASSKTIEEMVNYLPQTLVELRKIRGFGDVKVQQYGQQFLDIIIDYSRENELESLVHERFPKKERKKQTTGVSVREGTKMESYRLFKAGLDVDQIARQRKLTIQTIEVHLTEFLKTGELHINELLASHKLLMIQEALKEEGNSSIKPVKNKLGDLYGWGEIRWVVAWNQYQKQLHGNKSMDH